MTGYRGLGERGDGWGEGRVLLGAVGEERKGMACGHPGKGWDGRGVAALVRFCSWIDGLLFISWVG